VFAQRENDEAAAGLGLGRIRQRQLARRMQVAKNALEGGGDVAAELRAIAIEPIPDRIGHYLGDDLIFDLNGTGSHDTPKYRLFVTLRESVQTPIIDTVTGLQSAATVVLNADYRLEPYGGGTPVTKGTAIVIASYDRNSQRFANIRAARDAEIRDAKQLSDQIRLRLAAALSKTDG